MLLLLVIDSLSRFAIRCVPCLGENDIFGALESAFQFASPSPYRPNTAANARSSTGAVTASRTV